MSNYNSQIVIRKGQKGVLLEWKVKDFEVSPDLAGSEVGELLTH